MSTPKPVVVELKPCPNCGGKAKESWAFAQWCMECQECGLQIYRGGDMKHFEAVVNAWNRRVPTEPSPAPWCAACGTHGHTSGNCPEITPQMKEETIGWEDVKDQEEDDLTSVYLYAHHKRDDEVRALKRLLEEAEKALKEIGKDQPHDKYWQAHKARKALSRLQELRKAGE